MWDTIPSHRHDKAKDGAEEIKGQNREWKEI